MGYILHSYKLDSKKKPYLDHYCYVGSINQEVSIILPGYGEGLHTIQVDDITDEGIYFHYIVGKFGKGFLPRKEAKNVQAGSEHWDYVQGTVRSIAQYQIKLYTVDEFFKNVLKHRYPDKEWITKQVLDQMFPKAVLADYEQFAFPIEQMKRLWRHPWAYKMVWFLERCLFKVEKVKRKKGKVSKYE